MQHKFLLLLVAPNLEADIANLLAPHSVSNLVTGITKATRKYAMFVPHLYCLHSQGYLLPSPKADIANLLSAMWYERRKTPYVDELDSSSGRSAQIRSARK